MLTTLLKWIITIAIDKKNINFHGEKIDRQFIANFNEYIPIIFTKIIIDNALCFKT